MLLDSDESDDENDFEEKCPTECDPGIWNKVLELRERRLDQEEIITDIQKAVEALKKESDALVKKEKVILQTLKATEGEIQDFQTQKQRKLNELRVLVPLRFHQIHFLDNNQVPKDMSPALVFGNHGLSALRNRIKELQQEKFDIKKQHKELKKQHVNYNKSRKEKQAKLQELQDRARDVQMLKFGMIIDLEKLEKLGVNKVADELLEKAQKEDIKRINEIAVINVTMK